MTAPEIPLRLLFLPGKVHDDFTVSPPTLWEIVSAPEGVERICGYIATAETTEDSPSPYFSRHSLHFRTSTVFMWERLTGERLTPALDPVATERRET